MIQLPNPARPNAVGAARAGMRWSPAVAAVAALLAGAALGGPGTGGAVVFGTTVDDPDTVSVVAAALTLAVDDVNAAGGIGGRPLRLVRQGDGGAGDLAATVAAALVADPDVVAVVGHQSSAAMLAAARVYDGRLAVVSAGATSPLLTGISPWVFRVVSSDSAAAAALAALAARNGWRRVVIMYQNDLYGRSYASAFRHAFAGAVVRADPVDDGATAVDAFAQLYVRLRPDAMVLVAQPSTARAVLAAAERVGLTVPIVGTDAWADTAAEYAGPLDLYVVAPVGDAPSSARRRAFDAAFRQRFGRDGGPHAALVYDAVQLLATAVRRVGPERRAIQAYLATTATRDAFDGITGAIRLRQDGDRAGWPGRVLRCGGHVAGAPGAPNPRRGCVRLDDQPGPRAGAAGS